MPFTLTITLHDDGKLELHGPIDQKILCYGVLEAAKHAVQAHQPQARPRILAPVGPIIPSKVG